MAVAELSEAFADTQWSDRDGAETARMFQVTTWRLRTTLLVPTTVPVPPGGGMPLTLEFISRVPIRLGNTPVNG